MYICWFNIQNLINPLVHATTAKEEKSHMISINTEKKINIIQLPFIIKSPSTPGMEEDFSNVIKSIYK